jgi:hypothetical protein
LIHETPVELPPWARKGVLFLLCGPFASLPELNARQKARGSAKKE